MDKFFRLLPVLALLALGVGWLFPMAALGTRFGWWHFGVGFELLGGAVITDALLLVLAGVALILAIATQNPKAKHRATLVVLMALTPLGFVLFYSLQGAELPMIHDISTDQAHPPRLVALLAQRPADANPLAYTPDVAAAQAKAYPAIKPLTLKLTPVEALQRAISVARELGWDVVASDPAKGRLEATDTTFWFGFVDDIVVRITPEADGSKVDIRSVSRVGRGDLGKNAHRIQLFLQRMQAS